MAATEGLVPGHHLRTYDGERAECGCGAAIYWKGNPEEHAWHLLDVAFEDGIAAARRADRVHNVVEAERQAYAEKASRSGREHYQFIFDEIQRQNEARLKSRPSILRQVTIEVHRRKRAGDDR